MAQIERPRFQPVARPVDTVGIGTRFIDGAAPAPPVRRPAPMAPIQRAAPAPRSSIMDLAEALSGISKAINTIADPYYEAVREEERSEAEMLALANNVTSWGDMVRRDPSLSDRSPYFRSVYESRVARTRVQQFAGGLMGEYYSSGIANSDDPTAINGWLSDRFRPMIDQFQSPGERAAALAEFNQIAQQFTQAHQANARSNLVENNRRSFSAGMQARMDNHQRLGPARPANMQTNMPHLVTGEGGHRLTNPVQAAFLNATAARESSGHYNIRYNGRTPAFFDSFDRHPNVRVPLPGGNFSTAAGRYQITYSTWLDYAGPDVPFTPENQDMVALAIAYDRYKRLTGGDLWQDLEEQGLSYGILDILTPTWAAFGEADNRGEIIATFQQTMAELGGRLPEEAAVDGNFQALQADLIQMQEEARMQGISGEQINNTVIEAVIMKAIEHEDESLLALAMSPRLDGTPGPGSTVEGRKKIEAARQEIFRIQAANDAAKAKAEEDARKALHSKIYDTVAELFLQQMEENMTPNLSVEDRRNILQTAGEGGAELLDKIHGQLKRAREASDMVDPTIEAQVMAMVYSGAMSPQDVLESYLAGQISNSQLNSLMIEARRSREYGVLNNRVITGFIKSTAEIAANTLLSIPGVNVDDARMTVTVTEMMAEEALKRVEAYVRTNGYEPSVLTLLADLRDIRERVLDAVAPDNNEAALQYRERIRNNLDGPREDRPALLPNSGTNWRTTTILPTIEIFEDEIQKFNSDSPSVIGVWVEQVLLPEANGNPIRLARLLNEFESRQRALFRAPTTLIGGASSNEDDPNRR